MPLSKESRIVNLLRFLGYLSVSFAGLIIPLLVFKLTQSIQLVGLTLMMEWFPKVITYWFSGSIIQKFSAKKIHLILEITRFCCLGGFLCCSVFHLPSYYIGFFAAIFQCSNSFSNVIFEQLIVQWWPEIYQANGHSLITKRGIEAGFLVMIISIVMHDINYIMITALIIQLMTVCIVYLNLNKIHKNQLIFDFNNPLKIIFNLNTKIWYLLIFAIVFTFPSTIISSALPFFIQDIFKQSVEELTYIYRLMQMIANVLWMILIQYFLNKNPLQSKQLVYSGFFFIATSLTLIIFNQYYSNPILTVLTITSMMLLGVSLAFVSPWFREKRQQIVHRYYKHHKYELTGILISAEAVSPVLFGLILFCGFSLYQTLILAFTLIVITSLLLFKKHFY